MQPFSATTNNPFLCDSCQQLGYCRKSREAVITEMLPKYYKVLSELNLEYHFMKVSEVNNFVPIKTMVRDRHTVAGKKLQQAHDLFHQDEFEQASYLYRDLLTQRADYQEAAVGLAASYFLMKQYEQAAAVASGIDHFEFKKHLSDFLDACERLSKEERSVREQSVSSIKSSLRCASA
jgi:hypothetical protein